MVHFINLNMVYAILLSMCICTFMAVLRFGKGNFDSVSFWGRWGGGVLLQLLYTCSFIFNK